MPYFLIKHNPEQKQHRFYNLHLSPTLFQGWSLVREWGRVGSPGTVRINSFATEEEALQKQDELVKQKLKKGYLVTSA